MLKKIIQVIENKVEELNNRIDKRWNLVETGNHLLFLYWTTYEY